MANLLAIGAIINSALFLAAVFVAALVSRNAAAEYAAIAAFGATYLVYAADFAFIGRTPSAMRWLRLVPIIFAGFAFIALIG